MLLGEGRELEKWRMSGSCLGREREEKLVSKGRKGMEAEGQGLCRGREAEWVRLSTPSNGFRELSLSRLRSAEAGGQQ